MFHASADNYRVILGSHSDFGAGAGKENLLKQQLNQNEDLHGHRMQSGYNLEKKMDIST